MKPYAIIRTVISISSWWLYILAAGIEYVGTSFWLLSFNLFPIKVARGHAHRVEMGKSLVLSDSPELFFELII